MKNSSIRVVSLLLCLSMVLGYALVPGMMPTAKAAESTTSLIGENQIKNSTFEPEKGWLNRPKDNTAEGWTNTCSKCWSFVKDPDDSSNYVAYVNDNNTACNGGYIYYSFKAPTPGAYAVSFRYKTVNENASPSIYVREDWPASEYTDSTTGEKVDTPTQITNIPATGGEWKTYSFHTTVSETATTIYVLINSAKIAVTEAYFDDISFYSVDMDGLETRFLNLSFEQTDADGAITNWQGLDDGTIALSDDAKLGKKSLQVTDNSKTARQGAVSTWSDLYNHTALGYDEDDLRFVLSGRIKDTAKVSGQIALEFYDSGLDKISEITVTSAKSGQWQYLTAEGVMPQATAYARLALRVGDSASATGTVYFDDLTVMHYYGQYMEQPGDWKLLDKEPGSRVYYTDEELEQIKALAADDTVGAFGVSGRSMYDQLITKANSYRDKPELTLVYDKRSDYGWQNIDAYYYSLEEMQDVNTIDAFITIEQGKSPWPHLESLANTLRTYVQYLSMAYALTGDTTYADKAIQIAMGICAWEHWMELDYSWRTALGTELGSPRVVYTVATVYDMCYDVLTEEQKQIMEQSIINKGLLPLYNILTGPKKQVGHNKSMITCAALMFGALAVINEDNKDTVGKFLDRAYAFNKWYLDYQYETGSQEGYSYSRLCFEEPAVSMNCMTRVTGRQGLLNHPYYEEVLVNWLCDFLMPGSNNLPEYSDCHGSTTGTLFKGVMLILNKQAGNGKAGYYLQQTGLSGDPFLGLLYYNPNPVVTPPTDKDYVAFVDCVGYGNLRTGWEDGDMIFYIIGNNSQTGHNQYDQLSFQIIVGEGETAKMLAADPGYQRLDGFYEREGHNTIIVDGWGQTVKGQSTLSQVVDGKLYGQLTGSAPGAYGEGLLSQYDRHSIMINHDDRPYYIIIDELNSDTEHVYDWNLNTLGWSEVLVDGVALGNTALQGNKVAISGANGKLFVEFVSKNKLNIEGKQYDSMDKYAGSGKAYAGGKYPVLQADAGSSKSQQFLTILSKDYDGSVSSPIYTQEVYDTDKVLGAKIYHNAYNSDIILHNRTTGSITAGGVTTNGKQTTIIGLWENGYMEGYAVVAGTSLKLNNTVLMSAQNPATVSADFRGKASYIVTTETAQTVSLYASGQIIGVTVDGKDAEYTLSNGMAVVALAAGTRVVELITSEAMAYVHAEDGTLEKIAYYKNGVYDYTTDASGKRIDCGVHDYVEGVCSSCYAICEHVYDNDWDDACNNCLMGRKVSVVPNGTFDETAAFPAYRITKEGQTPGWKTGGNAGQANLGAYITKAWHTDGKWSLRIDDNTADYAVSMNSFVALPATSKTGDRTITLTFDYNVTGTISAQFLVAGKNLKSKVVPEGTGRYTLTATVASDVTEVQIKITTRSTESGIVAYFDNLACTVDGSENLLTNPSFEEDVVGVVQSTVDGVALKKDHWYMSQSEIIYKDNTWQNGVLKVEYMNSSESASPNIEVQVVPNTTYTFTFDYMTGSGTTQPKMFIRENTTSSSEITILEEKLALKTGWTTMTYSVTTKATTNVICIFPNFTSGQTDGVLYLDNVSLVKVCTHSYEAVVTAPTCTKAGYTTYTCSGCGNSYTGNEVAATGHSYEKVVVKPTCTMDGYTTYTCTNCGDSYFDDEVEAPGHSYKKVVTAATCTTAGYTTYTCSVCGYSYVTDKVAPSHTYKTAVIAPTCTEEGYTTYTCVTCGYSYDFDFEDALGHNYVDGACSNCGAADPDAGCGDNHSWNEGEVTVAAGKNTTGIMTYTCTACGEQKEEVIPPVLRFNGATLTLMSNVQVNFTVSRAILDEYGYTDLYAVFTYTNRDKQLITVTVTEYRLTDKYVFDFTELAPDLFGNTITATLYAKNNGKEYVSKTIEYSVLTYCNNQLKAYAAAVQKADLCFRTMLVDLLNYGAAAQLESGNNTDALVNAGLTEEQKSWGSTASGGYVSIQGAGDEVETPRATWKSASLLLEDAVTMVVTLEAADLEGLSVKVNCGKFEFTYDCVVDPEAEEQIFVPGEKENRYKLYINELPVYAMRDPVYITVYKDGEAASRQLTYSVESYVANKYGKVSESFDNMLDAMMRYGDAVNAYVTALGVK